MHLALFLSLARGLSTLVGSPNILHSESEQWEAILDMPCSNLVLNSEQQPKFSLYGPSFLSRSLKIPEAWFSILVPLDLGVVMMSMPANKMAPSASVAFFTLCKNALWFFSCIHDASYCDTNGTLDAQCDIELEICVGKYLVTYPILKRHHISKCLHSILCSRGLSMLPNPETRHSELLSPKPKPGTSLAWPPAAYWHLRPSCDGSMEQGWSSWFLSASL